MRKALLGMFLLMMASVAFGQGSSGSIEGTVFEEPGKPLMYSSVWVEVGGVQKGATTDERGKFRTKPLAMGTYDLHVSSFGNPTFIVENVQVSRDGITRIEDVVISKFVELKDFTVKWVEPVINFDEVGKMTVKGAELMATPLSRDPVGFIASLGDGVIQQDQGQPLYIRGGRADAVKYIIDGMNVDGINLPSRGIGEISMYTSGIPAKYGDVLSGVIVIETKSYFDLYNQYNN